MQTLPFDHMHLQPFSHQLSFQWGVSEVCMYLITSRILGTYSIKKKYLIFYHMYLEVGSLWKDTIIKFVKTNRGVIWYNGCQRWFKSEVSERTKIFAHFCKFMHLIIWNDSSCNFHIFDQPNCFKVSWLVMCKLFLCCIWITHLHRYQDYRYPFNIDTQRWLVWPSWTYFNQLWIFSLQVITKKLWIINIEVTLNG